MDESIDIGDYVALSENGLWWEVIGFEPIGDMLTIRSIKSRNVAYVKPETVKLCQKNP